MLLLDMDQARAARVIEAIELLRVYVPAFYEHLMAEVERVEFGPGSSRCHPQAGACAGGHLGRAIILVADPLFLEIIDLAALIAHECLHIATDPQTGLMITREHTCNDAMCSRPHERAQDWIYAKHVEVELHLRRATGIVKAAPPAPPRQPTAGEAMAAMAFGAFVGLLIGVALGGRA